PLLRSMLTPLSHWRAEGVATRSCCSWNGGCGYLFLFASLAKAVILTKNCHPERSEGSLAEQAQILRCAQDDNSLDDISLEELFFMTLSPDIQSTLQRYQKEIEVALRRAVFRASEAATQSGVIDILSYYGQMQYHLC